MTRIVLLMPVAAVLVLVAIYLLTPLTQLELPGPRGGYLDAHAHIACIGAGDSGCYVNDEVADSYKFDFYLSWLDVTRRELETRGDELVARRMNRLLRQSTQVRRAVVLALDGVVRDGRLDRSATQIYVPNAFVAEMADKYEYLEYGASIHPERPDWRRRLEQAKRDGALLVKWLPAIMHIDPADPRYIPFYNTLVELDLPLLVHVGQERALVHARDELGDPAKLALPLEQGVTVIAAHIATTGRYEDEPGHERLLAMLEDHPNLYTDISSLTQINKLGYLVEALQTPGAAQRMIYGSDWPLQFFPLVSPIYHWPDIDLGQAKTINRIENPWDRDVALKTALGVPPGVFTRSAELLMER